MWSRMRESETIHDASSQVKFWSIHFKSAHAVFRFRGWGLEPCTISNMPADAAELLIRPLRDSHASKQTQRGIFPSGSMATIHLRADPPAAEPNLKLGLIKVRSAPPTTTSPPTPVNVSGT